MRAGFAAVACLALAGFCLGQADFECQTVGPFPLLPTIDCQGIGAAANSNTLAPLPSVTNTASCGMSSKYAVIPASGNSTGSGVGPAVGGPLARPLQAYANELRIPIPSGAPGISFQWEFYDGEVAYGYIFPYNDVFTVEVVDSATGLAILPPIVYIDSATLQGFGTPATASIGTCTATVGTTITTGPELAGPIGTSGPQNVTMTLPPLPATAYLSIVCMNGGDDGFRSAGVIDNLLFGPPCVFTLNQPFGTGSVGLSISGCTANATFFIPVSFAAGSYPNGPFLGISLSYPELITEISFGFPFFGALDPAGAMGFALPGGVPVGLDIYAGAGLFAPGGGTLIKTFTPQHITIQ